MKKLMCLLLCFCVSLSVYAREVKGQSCTFQIPDDVKFKSQEGFYFFLWGKEDQPTVMELNLLPLPMDESMRKNMVNSLANTVEAELKGNEEISEVKKETKDLEIGNLKGTRLGLMIKTKDGLNLKQNVMIMGDGKLTWICKVTGTGEKDLEKAIAIMKKAKVTAEVKAPDISSLMPAEPRTEIEIPVDAPGSSVFYATFYDFLKKHILNPYKKASKNEVSKAYLDDVLKKISKQPDSKELSVLLEEGKNLKNKDHAGVFAYGYCLYKDKKYKEAMELLNKKFQEIRKKKGLSNVYRFLYFAVLRKCVRELRLPPKKVWSATYQSFMAAVQKNEFEEKDSRIMFYLNWELMNYNVVLLEAAKKKRKKFPWLFNVMTGIIEKDKAWDERGNSWASEVDEKGWEGFRKHLEKSREALTKAYEMKPDRPEAAAQMITVAMGGGSKTGEDEVFWFNRSVKAEIDYPVAYTKIYWALRPRWGGSYDVMYEVADTCLKTKRFDTDVPESFLMGLSYIADDMSGYTKGYYFRRKATRDNLKELFEGALKYAKTEKEKQRIKGVRVICDLLSGQYKNAEMHLKEIDANFEFRNIFSKYGNEELFNYSRREIEDQIRAGLKDPEKMNEAYLSFYDGDIAGAIKKLLGILETVDEKDQGAREFLISEIGYMMLNTKTHKTEEGRSGFSQSAYEGNKAAFDLLLELGADVNNCDIEQNTPLHFAVREAQDTDMIKALLKKGADINKANKSGWTPLHHAARYAQSTDLVKLLIDKGADLKAKTDANYTPAKLAKFNDNPEILAYFQKNTDPGDATPDDKGEALMIEIKSGGSVDNIKRLLKEGANINYQDHKGNTPLHVAIGLRNIPVVKLLLENKADRKIKNTMNLTPEKIIVMLEHVKQTRKDGKAIRKLFNTIK